MSDVINVEFEKIGSLAQIDNGKGNGAGVYLFVFQNKIIYVGSAKISYAKRLSDHRRYMRRGGMTIWRPGKDDDLYTDLMKHKSDRLEFYTQKEESEKVWIPGIKYGKIWESKFKKMKLSDWEEYISWYMDSISIIGSKPNSEIFDPEILEHKIQKILKDEYEISYYKETGESSWLGQYRHKPGNTSSFNLVGLPEVEDHIAKVLKTELRLF